MDTKKSQEQSTKSETLVDSSPRLCGGEYGREVLAEAHREAHPEAAGSNPVPPSIGYRVPKENLLLST